MQKRDLTFYDYEREPVPIAKRKKWLTLAFVWIAIGIDLSAVLLGTQLGAGMTLSNAVLAVIAGSLLLAVLGSFTAYVGAVSGLSTAMISRYVFGEHGAKLVSGVIGISLFGWFGVQAGFFGASAHTLLLEVLGVKWSPTVLAMVGGLLMTSTAVVGYRAIEWLNVWSVPLMVGILVGAVIWALTGQPLSALLTAPPTGSALPMGLSISLVASSFLVGTVITPDLARWAKTPRDAVLSSFFGFLIGTSLMLLIVVLLTKATGSSDILHIFVTMGFGVPAIIVLILAQWTTNHNNLYSASLGFSVIFSRVPKYLLTIIAGLIGTVLAYLDIFNHFLTFLTYLTAFIAPIGGIYLAEFFLLNRSRFQFVFIREEYIPGFYWHAVLVWVIAAFIGLATTPAPNGLGWFSLTTIPLLDSFLTGFLLQWVLGKVREKMAAGASSSVTPGE
ncbi:cytosine permease [Polycladomyces sp. WAk]|uniref:Cytosine permease n=1 Tax=Polycladomyces zharkentensis TaxID=2807616 RepID=A0ABS2WK21_9BACL|nr:cytosine permease [Polycladomyces sp. WAk]MBN2909898.1 cytosine permease [Polycladomyces sp. WAk]